MSLARTLKGAATAVLSTMVVATAIAGPMSGTALAKGPKPRATVPTVTANPSTKPTSSSTMVFSWTPETGQSYSCTLTGPGQSGAKSNCNSGSASYTGLTTGTYTFAMRVTQSGFRAGSFTYVWNVDRTAPAAPIVDPITSPTSNRTANVTWTASEAGETFLCALDDNNPADATGCSPSASPANSSTSWPLSGLADGPHTAYVYGVDSLGNKNATPGTVTWTVDTTAPSSPVITVTPAGPTNQTSASISWVDGDATSFKCALDADVPVTCTNPWPVSGLSEGTHVVTVQGTDAAKNVGVPGVAHWVVDLTPPPAPSITSGPAKTTDQTTGLFYFSDADSTATFQCAVDGGAYTSCSSPYTFSESTAPTAAEPHSFSVKATDQAQNTGPATPYLWTIDPNVQASPPEITAGPAALTNSTSPSFTFDSLDDLSATFLCAVDPADSTDQTAYTTCSSPQTENVSTDGAHTFYVEEVSSASGSQLTSTPDSWTWTLDRTAPPAPLFNSKPNASSNVKTPLFSFSDDEANVTYTCQRDAGTPFTCVSPVTLASLADGSHTFSVSATDAAGNTAAGSTASYTWTVDTVAPGKPTVTGSDPSGTSPEISISDPADSDVASYLCTLDTSAAASCGSTVDYTDLTPGSHSLLVQAVDQAGNIGQPQSFSWTVDGTVPSQPTVDSGPASLVNTRTADFSYSMPDTTAVSVQCWLDNQQTLCTLSTPTSGSLHLTQLADGDHTFTVLAVNNLGNKTASAAYNWTVDATSPAAPTITGPASLTNQASSSVSFADTDSDVTHYTCSLDNQAETACPTSYTVGDGAHSLVAYAWDAAGNKSAASATFHWTVDLTKPAAPAITGPSGLVNQAKSNVSFADTSVDVASYTCSLDGAAETACPSSYTVADGSHSLVAFAVDAAGNKSVASAADTWTVDTVAPAAPSITGPAALVNQAKSNVSFADTSGDVAGYTCSLDGGAATACPSSFTVADGAHSLVAFATDAAGNKSAGSAAFHWTVDTTAPAAPAVSGAATTTNTQPSFSINESDATAALTCSIDAAAGTSCADGWSPAAALAVGTHHLVVTATDAAGNATSSTPFAFTVVPLVTDPSGPTDTTPPTVTTVAATKTLTGTTSAVFSETVHGPVAAGDVALVLTGTSTVVPTAVKCLNGATVVACSTGSFTSMQLVATSPLTAGQHYSVRFNAGAVKDAAGNALVAKSVDFRASRNEQENSVAAKAAWTKVSSKSAYGRSFVRANLSGSSATFTFTGTTLTWWTTTGKNQGKATVYIDGKKKATVNNYATATHFKVARKYGKLSNKRHTVRIVVNGVKGAKAGTGTFISVDAFTVGKKRTNTPALRMTLHSVSSKHFSGGHATSDKLKGETITFTFRGTAIAFYTEKARNQGKVAVYVDGVKKATFDNYSAKTAYGVKRAITKLSDKVHTLKLVVLGTHHKGGTGTWVTVDRFLVS